MRRVLLVVVVIWWVTATAAQVRLWHDEYRMWAQAVRVAPEKPRTWVNLAQQEVLKGTSLLAEDSYHRALWLALTRPESERRHTVHIVNTNLARMQLDVTAWINTP